MIGDITVADEIYIVCGYTDMRKSIDGLCAIVEDKLHMDQEAVPCSFSAETVRPHQDTHVGTGWLCPSIQKAFCRSRTIPLASQQR